MIRRAVLIICMIVLWSAQAYTEPQKRLAILSFTTKNVPQTYESIVKDMFEVSLYKSKHFRILERVQINLILQEHGIQKTGCFDTTCAVDIGKLVSADLAAYGSIVKLEKYRISFKIIDVKNLAIEFTETLEVDGENDFQNAVDTITKNIIRQIILKDSTQGPQVYVKTGDYYLRGIVPGWAQMYSGHNIKGYAFMGGFVLSGLSAIGTWFYFDKKDRDYHNLGYGRDKRTYDNAYDKYYNSAVLFYSSLAVCSLVYIASWVDVVFFNETIEVKVGLDSDSRQSFGSSYHGADAVKINGAYLSIGMKF